MFIVVILIPHVLNGTKNIHVFFQVSFIFSVHFKHKVHILCRSKLCSITVMPFFRLEMYFNRHDLCERAHSLATFIISSVKKRCVRIRVLMIKTLI